MTAAALMSRHTSAWQAATVHPFLAGVRDGSLPEHSFDRWLAQDYLFAQALVRAQSRIAATAPLAPPHPVHAANPPSPTSAAKKIRRPRMLRLTTAPPTAFLLLITIWAAIMPDWHRLCVKNPKICWRQFGSAPSARVVGAADRGTYGVQDHPQVKRGELDAGMPLLKRLSQAART